MGAEKYLNRANAIAVWVKMAQVFLGDEVRGQDGITSWLSMSHRLKDSMHFFLIFLRPQL